MNNEAKKIGMITIGILAGLSVLSRSYNAKIRKACANGRAKGYDEGFDNGKDVGYQMALSTLITYGIIDDHEMAKLLGEYFKL